MAATRRNQALHDQLTRSTVQMRDPAKARPGHYITERTELANPNMPSRTRRAFVILVYLLLAFVVFILIYGALMAVGFISALCVNTGRCTMDDRTVETVAGLIWIALSGCFIVLDGRAGFWARACAHNPDGTAAS